MIDIQRIVQAKSPLTLASAPVGFLPLLMADLARAAAMKGDSGGRAVFIAPDEATMRALVDAARYFAPELKTSWMPAWDCLPYDRSSPSLKVSADRLAALAALQIKPSGPELFVTTLSAATQLTLTPFRVRQLTAHLAPGKQLDRDRLSALLMAHGYVRTDTVAEAGEFAVRGGLLDLFPAGRDQALRLDFFGDEIESVRTFDPADQRTTGRIDEFTLLPVSEALLDEDSIKRFRSRYRERFGATATGDPLYEAVSSGRRLAGMEHWLPLFEERLATIFDHLGPNDIIIRDEGTSSAADARFEAIADYYQNRQKALRDEPGSYRPLPTETLYISPSDWQANLNERPIHLTTGFDEPESDKVINCGANAPRDFTPERAAQSNVYEAVSAHVAALKRDKRKVVLASYSVGSRSRLQGLLADHGMKRTVMAESWQEALGHAGDGSTALAVVPLDHGFTTSDIAVLTEQDMLGDRLVRRRRRKNADAFLAELQALVPGDLVVHIDHGIGRYEGLVSIPVGQSPHDCVQLAYGGGDKLYVPVENIDVLSRYGAEGDAVSLDRLGGAQWQARKARMKDRIREIAGVLLATAAQRALRNAPAYQTDTASYNEFIARFPYEETDDQDRAIDDVISDLAAGKPMDRLVCGDVGFGKTEVALRAAFVAAMQGVQVALICPTTLLARQHFATFSERFAGFPLVVRHLSRLVTSTDAARTRTGLEDGTVDIVIGTHALLAKSINFKRLGMVIVDEEQKFGVTHKERLKALKADVHVLTLTATPIPRTLQMAMSGLRELSVIQTPPVDRLAVRTYVMPWDDMVVREALLREHFRGGQSFFVTPRIADITDIEAYLREYVPEVRYVVAHGQMSATEVEERMSAFYDKKYDVLVSTTIIESGIDIPSANTLIIHRADMYGLAQLYQLRGRVGRSKTRAYAYLTTPADRAMTETADKRLKVLSSLDSLGAGFQLASHDLDIRGAGNLLGDEQSGHIREIGFELYQSMLEDAIAAARAENAGLKAPEDAYSPQITVDAPIMLPDDYVPDLNLRMALYRRMNDLEGRDQIESFAAEMIDRFGPLPDATQNLLTLIEAKLNCRTAHIQKLEIGPRGAVVSFRNDSVPNPAGLIAYVQRLNGIAKLRPDQKLVIGRNWPSPAARLNGAAQLAKGLAKVARAKS